MMTSSTVWMCWGLRAGEDRPTGCAALERFKKRRWEVRGQFPGDYRSHVLKYQRGSWQEAVAESVKGDFQRIRN